MFLLRRLTGNCRRSKDSFPAAPSAKTAAAVTGKGADSKRSEGRRTDARRGKVPSDAAAAASRRLSLDPFDDAIDAMERERRERAAATASGAGGMGADGRARAFQRSARWLARSLPRPSSALSLPSALPRPVTAPNLRQAEKIWCMALAAI